jgi:succinate dehydrogenase (ubiquinone) cytochrome b560 subunit
MSLLMRASCRKLLAPSLQANNALRSMAVMKPMTPEEHTISRADFWEKNKNLQRPLSPHLTIYKFQLTSMLSITHRGTGLIQSAYLSAFAAAAMFLPGTFPMWLQFVQDMQFGMPLIFLAKFGLAWPVCFHLFNGLRHLAWDIGMGFKIADLYKSGWTVLGISIIAALGLAML